MTPARWAAIGRANAALRVCPVCGLDDGYRIPRSLGRCWPCAATDQHEHEHEHDRIERKAA